MGVQLETILIDSATTGFVFLGTNNFSDRLYNVVQPWIPEKLSHKVTSHNVQYFIEIK